MHVSFDVGEEIIHVLLVVSPKRNDSMYSERIADAINHISVRFGISELHDDEGCFGP
ncbi:hypothetical protein D3C86_2004410 [compost metagenome]